MGRFSFYLGAIAGVTLAAMAMQGIFKLREHRAEQMRRHAAAAGIQLGNPSFSVPHTTQGWWMHGPTVGVWWPVDKMQTERQHDFFPGYDAFDSDAMLWSKLQSLPVDYSLRWQDSDQLYLLASSESCLPIIERHGVDILLIGNCEGYRATRVDRWASAFAGRRVLPCFRNESDTPFAKRVADGLVALAANKRPSKVAWFISPWQILTEGLQNDAMFAAGPNRVSAIEELLRKWSQSIDLPNYRSFTHAELARPGAEPYVTRSLGRRRRHVLGESSDSSQASATCLNPRVSRGVEAIARVVDTFVSAGTEVTLAIPSYLALVHGTPWGCIVEKLRSLSRPQVRVFTFADGVLKPESFAFSIGDMGSRSVLHPQHLNAKGAALYTEALIEAVAGGIR